MRAPCGLLSQHGELVRGQLRHPALFRGGHVAGGDGASDDEGSSSSRRSSCSSSSSSSGGAADDRREGSAATTWGWTRHRGRGVERLARTKSRPLMREAPRSDESPAGAIITVGSLTTVQPYSHHDLDQSRRRIAESAVASVERALAPKHQRPNSQEPPARQPPPPLPPS